MTDDGFETLGEIPRNEKDVLKIRKGKYWNIEVIDIRWFTNDKISRKGVRMNIEEARHLLNLLRRQLE